MNLKSKLTTITLLLTAVFLVPVNNNTVHGAENKMSGESEYYLKQALEEKLEPIVEDSFTFVGKKGQYREGISVFDDKVGAFDIPLNSKERIPLSEKDKEKYKNKLKTVSQENSKSIVDYLFQSNNIENLEDFKELKFNSRDELIQAVGRESTVGNIMRSKDTEVEINFLKRIILGGNGLFMLEDITPTNLLVDDKEKYYFGSYIVDSEIDGNYHQSLEYINKRIKNSIEDIIYNSKDKYIKESVSELDK